jgi:hypothetical protein
MRITICIFFLLCITGFELEAQSYFYNNDYYDNAVTYEAGISIGPMNSLTDIGGRPGLGQSGPKDLNIKSTTLFGSIYGMAIYKHFFALRLEATAGSVKSNDSLLAGIKSPNKAIGRYNRNLSFRSPIYEISLTAEFHPIDFFSNPDPEKSPSAFSPYLVGGIGFFHFNPQANLNGQWIDLRPLHTEGQGFAEYPGTKEYKLNQINIPLGVGVSYELSGRFNVRIEYLNRVLYTDYLDDVHGRYIDPAIFSKYLGGTQLTDALILNNRVRSDAVPNETTARPAGIRGNPLNNDSYFTINLKVGFVFGRESANSGTGGGWGGNGKARSRNQKRQLKCPRIF